MNEALGSLYTSILEDHPTKLDWFIPDLGTLIVDGQHFPVELISEGHIVQTF